MRRFRPAASGLLALCLVLTAGVAGAVNLTPPHGRHVPPLRLPPPVDPATLVTTCDSAAASPDDGQRTGPGVSTESLDANLALAQCGDAVRLYPTTARFHYQLGRARQKLGDYTGALESYRRAAELGSPIGAFSAAVMLRDGNGVVRDDDAAARLLAACADKGDPACLNALGYQYQQGLGVGRDPARAAALYRQAADGGLASAAVNLGFLYRDGEGVARDYAEAARLFRLAADKGDAVGSRNLALFYRDGLGVPKDEALAVTYFQQAADRGDEDALIKLAFAYISGSGVGRDAAKSFSYYQQAAGRGSSDGMAGLAYAYANGLGVAADGKMAAFWMLRALAAGNEYSFDQLANHWNAWNLDMRVATQAMLRDRGLYGGELNGTLNRETLAAIRRLAGR
ncbi:tetratricopeptide repeat protein [Labrys monachus]|uniref:TPR repeat protein n=1 Tax=Labrys monachus TaxID=217067 RepID=A0ABU0FI44_9HYPH|nr:hypothetical protein [Labrys monachus]MDQ0394284.1 TPR repeat protein [Labrys monachus]